ncbi:hypothetical protein [Rhodococcus sp. 114MFTsu3.1]|uniref:hypothetical protein n=1 Tax=Rhodococcus sp. 114MFTsu3.1 TaxID=1172184 RepID=UPI0003633941|nr:hypothetical protein [Rhodococcus sp. 114MFTsu3.1]
MTSQVASSWGVESDEHESSTIHVCLDASATADAEDHVWLTGSPPAKTVFIRADDLGQAQSMRTRIRRELGTEGEDAASFAVVLELETHIADDARTARKELASSSTGATKTVRYVGTSSGLAGLVADIEAASVADAVLIIPIVSSRRQAVCNRISAEVVPLLRRMA